MTNAEKYQEVFGFPPVIGECPTSDCKKCPLRNLHKGEWYCSTLEDKHNWWNEEYKGGAE